MSRSYSAESGPRDYSAAVAALNTLQSNFSAVEAIKKLGPGWNKQALPEMREYARRIGYESSNFDRLNPIHVAGTKGKGSTSSFISSILSQYLSTKCSIHAERLPSSVGLYTSPHLRFVRERIKIDNQPISEELFAKCFWELWDRLEATTPPTPSSAVATSQRGNAVGKPVYFHYLTLMALHCYLQEAVGTAVVECGIGGEYDTTNILVKPSVTGVTSLGIDHESLLGDTIESIAWHKAGIFKEGVPAFTVPQPEKALEVLRERAKERQTEVFVVPRHQALEGMKLGLQGEFQKVNASLAVAISAMHLQRLGFNGVPNPYDSVSALPQEFMTGLECARLGGRCDMRQDSKAKNLTWYIDGGHTLESIEMAGRWFASSVATSLDATSTTRILIFNQQTRDASTLARRLHSTLASATSNSSKTGPQLFQHAIFCPNTTYKDAGYKADLVSMNTNQHDIASLKVQNELAATWEQVDAQANVSVVGTIEEAVGRAREAAESGRQIEVLVTGSLHLVGGLIEVLESEVEKGDSRL
ncbi:hypothetical protein LTR37_003959 [Vermiconidia calcicola]|uniref:Uncharacterized protein n=1 Tax=Vermiconidia calcicola TaxID=1690605 RepID=A0ACC3NRB8_9PEZI|nr:hypothetical protein LTR37_003959 [Vermiconidia calcicola]